MKPQVIYFHGGDVFESRSDYLNSLKTKDIERYFLKDKNWEIWTKKMPTKIRADLFCMQMPCSDFAKYKEWKIWFERFLPKFSEELTLVGWSLGGIFLLKYLSEEGLKNKKLNSLFLIASPFDGADDCSSRALEEFIPKKDIKNIEKLTKNIYIYHSKDDFVVSFSQAEKIKQRLQSSTLRVFEDRNHFIVENFKELFADINKHL